MNIPLNTATKRKTILTDAAIKNAKPKEKDYKLSAGNGLYLLVKPSGGKYWRYKYNFLNKERLLAIGIYPDVSLIAARQKRDEAKKLLNDGVDPSKNKQQVKTLAILQANTTFEAIANEWLEKQTQLASVTLNKSRWLLNYAIAAFGKKAITDVSSSDVLAACRPLEQEGKVETAHRIASKASQVFRYAIVTNRATNNPSRDLRGALKPVQTQHRAAITDPEEVAHLMRAIDSYQGHFVTQYALKLMPLVFVRPVELRTATWQDIDLDAAEWRYHVSKTNTDHIVPLSRQALTLIKELKELSVSNSPYLFPSIRTNSRPISDNTINPALRRLGYSGDQMCGHGFRAMARTILEEFLNFRIEIIEQQLAHTVKDMHGRAYNRTKHLEERKIMMQKWADYLEDLSKK